MIIIINKSILFYLSENLKTTKMLRIVKSWLSNRIFGINSFLKRLILFVNNPMNVSLLFPLTHNGLFKAYKFLIKKYRKFYLLRVDRLNKMKLKNYSNIDPSKGFTVFRFNNKKLLIETLNFCKKKFSVERILKEAENLSKKNTLLSLPIDISIKENKPIKKLALHPEIIKPVGNYLGGLPILYGCYIWYSPNDKNINLIGSQLYHFDREDYRQIKCFIPIRNISEKNGTLNVIPAKNSREFMNKRGQNEAYQSLKQRFSDNEVYQKIGEKFKVELKAKTGEIILLDTSNCLHFGSRKSEKPKYHITLHYITPFNNKVYKKTQNITSNNHFSSKSNEELILDYI
tara:strand:+ start:600 stop:1631 length:1032 start_codon:yes stop_codon:yes gene_type:complete